MKLSVVIPAYNEVNTIRQIIGKINEVNGFDKEIIIVDDFSKDGTRELLRQMQGDGIKVFFHEKNLGKGAAIRTGFKHITGDIIIIQDADLEYNPQDYHKLVGPIRDGLAEVVYGSRFLTKQQIFCSKRPFYLTHFVGNKFLNFVMNLLYNAKLTDMETCYKAVKADIIKNMHLTAMGFEIEPEITVNLLLKGFKIYEVPIVYHPRDYSEGKKISWRDGLKALYVILKHRFQR